VAAAVVVVMPAKSERGGRESVSVRESKSKGMVA
jgi:hypothetical protein